MTDSLFWKTSLENHSKVFSSDLRVHLQMAPTSVKDFQLQFQFLSFLSMPLPTTHTPIHTRNYYVYPCSAQSQS